MIDVGDKARPFRDIIGWFNTDKMLLEDYLGNVIYLEFWDHTNLSSVVTIEFTKKLWKKYRDKGLYVIGVHSPEYEFERYMENVGEAINRYNIGYPVVQDNNNSTWLLYGNRYIPRQFIIDKDGNIVYGNVGQGREYDSEKMIREKLGLDENTLGTPLWEKSKKEPILLDISPETYLGSKEIMSVKKFSKYQLAHDVNYNDPGYHELNKVYLNGRWKQFDEFIENEGVDSEHMAYRFRARRVFIVMSSYVGRTRFEVLLDNEPLKRNNAGSDILWDQDGQSYIEVSFSGLYNLISRKDVVEGELMLIPREIGLQFYVLSFD